MNRDAVLQHLGVLHAARIKPAIPDAHQRRGFLTEQQAGRAGQRLPVVVVDDPRKFIQIGLVDDHCAGERPVSRRWHGRKRFAPNLINLRVIRDDRLDEGTGRLDDPDAGLRIASRGEGENSHGAKRHRPFGRV